MKKKTILFGLYIFLISIGCTLFNAQKALKNFDITLLKPASAEIKNSNWDGSDGEKYFQIKILLRDFRFEKQNTKTSIVLDFIPSKKINIHELENKTFEFPINPDPGYIDGSIYLSHSHNPVDVKKITFGKITGNVIETSIYYDIIFEFENTGYRNITDQKMTFPLSLEKLRDR
ncbi:hypothetical protein [Chryseobacterium angstadtii]|uniref:hypothetical protein n=1 Tax=Chryseobacterium angstadtii TaxID=558151 RepID=UPI00065A9D47|nr:hypothetical protein [Chryseobacterium angstadtii]